MLKPTAIRTGLLSAAALAALAAVPQQSFADELWNFFITPQNGATDFEATFTGNIIGNITLTNNPGYNPFENGTLTDSYDVGSNTTTVEWAGTAGPPWANGSVATGNTVHFGIQGGPWLTPNSWNWTFPSAPPVSEPAVDLAPNWSPPSSPTQYITMFLQETDPTTGLTAGNWFELPYGPGLTPSIMLTNPNGDTLNFSNFGYMISPTEIPLDQLNFGTEPPTGQSGSMFTPLPSPGSLAPNASESANLPEPATGLIALGGLGLLLARRRKTA